MAATNTSRMPFLVICIKLTAVMGLTWILALIANWELVTFLQYPSTVLNSLQGTHFFKKYNSVGNTTPDLSSLPRGGSVVEWLGRWT